MAKVSVVAQAKAAKQEEAARGKAMMKALSTQAMASPKPDSGQQLRASTIDSFVNFLHKLGVGADNALTSGSYGYNPITRIRTLLEWIHRGSWLGGQAIDIPADDMTREGVEFVNEMEPEDAEVLEAEAERLAIWQTVNEGIKWSRLYGGSIVVMLVDGQDMKTPLRLEAVAEDQFRGLAVFDRWMVEPSLSDLVTDLGPHLGMPKYYTVQASAPYLRGAVIHYSRIAFRGDGIRLPYQQRLTENLWGISVLERLYDRMVSFDSASTGAAQLVFKSHLRTFKVEGLRDVVAAGGDIMKGMVAYVETVRRFQGIEGISIIDAADDFEVQSSTSGMTGVPGIIEILADQIAGALQIPKTRLFGQSPGGLGSNGKGEEKQYYDGIRQKQVRELGQGILTTYKLIAASKGIKLPDNFALQFASLRTLDDEQRVKMAKDGTAAIVQAYDDGLLSQQVAMQELRQLSRTTGIFSNISAEDIEAADDTLQEPMSELDLQTGIAQAKAATAPAPGKADNKKLSSDPSVSKAAGTKKPGSSARTPLKD